MNRRTFLALRRGPPAAARRQQAHEAGVRAIAGCVRELVGPAPPSGLARINQLAPDAQLGVFCRHELLELCAAAAAAGGPAACGQMATFFFNGMAGMVAQGRLAELRALGGSIKAALLSHGVARCGNATPEYLHVVELSLAYLNFDGHELGRCAAHMRAIAANCAASSEGAEAEATDLACMALGVLTQVRRLSAASHHADELDARLVE